MIAQLIYYWYCDAQGSIYYHIFYIQNVEGVSWYTTKGWVDMNIVSSN